MDTFGKRLKEVRKQKNLSQDELAEMLEVTRAAVASWETRGREPDHATLVHLSNVLNVSLDYLLGVSDEPARVSPRPSSWLDKLPNDLKAQMEDLISTGDMGALYLRVGIGMAKNAQLSDYPPDALEAIAKAAIDGGMMVRKKRLELEREGKKDKKKEGE